jgi:hypothetical protein
MAETMFLIYRVAARQSSGMIAVDSLDDWIVDPLKCYLVTCSHEAWLASGLVTM